MGNLAKCYKLFCENFSYVKKVLLELNHEDSATIKETKELISKSSLEANLIYIKSNFGFIPSEIKKLEASGILLSESINKIKQIETTLSLAPNAMEETISNKLKNVLLKNNGFKVLRNISAILDSENTTSRNGILEELTLNEMVHSCSFLFGNLKNHLIVQCNNICIGEKKIRYIFH
jgi:hypothetical protein